jgi:hypothetical protein
MGYIRSHKNNDFYAPASKFLVIIVNSFSFLKAEMNTVLSHYNYVSPSNEGRHIALVWYFLPLPLLRKYFSGKRYLIDYFKLRQIWYKLGQKWYKLGQNWYKPEIVTVQYNSRAGISNVIFPGGRGKWS